jgi:acetolactate synthase-1/2/3 large subunit
MKLTIAGILLKYLKAEGVEYLFGVPGTSLISLFAACNRNKAIKPIPAKHEEGAGFMADGYARIKKILRCSFL